MQLLLTNVDILRRADVRQAAVRKAPIEPIPLQHGCGPVFSQMQIHMDTTETRGDTGRHGETR